MNKYSLLISLVYITGLVLFLKYCDPDDSNIVRPEIIYQDTGTHTVTITPHLIYEKADTEWIFMDVDTNAILNDYFTERFYLDTIVDDTATFISVSWRTKNNKSDSLKVNWANKRATAINYNVKLNYKEIFGSLEIGANKNNGALWVGLDYRCNKTIYALSYDVFNKGVKVGIKYKLLNLDK